MKMNKASMAPEPEKSPETILTKGQFQILFDDTNGVLTIKTGANKMILSDQEKSISISDVLGNSIIMSPDGIVIASVKDIKIKASQNIIIEAAGTLNAKGIMGVTASGLSVALCADMDLTATGGASAQLASSGVTTVRGVMVMIN